MSEVLVDERLLSPSDLAAYLRVPLQTVYGWRCRGGGPRGYRIGKHVRYRQVDVEEWLASRGDDVLQSNVARG
jgi:excisionase family DNA binding protein